MIPLSNQPSEVLQVSLLGTMRVQCGERVADYSPTRQAALLLAYLLVSPKRHPRDEIVDLLWPDADLESGRARLSQAIWRLRQTLPTLGPASSPDCFLADRSTIASDPAVITCDVARFRAGLQAAEKLQGTARADVLASAAAIYTDGGEFLSGYYNDWVLAERRVLLAEYLGALSALTQYYEIAGDWPKALSFAEQAVAADPLHESSQQALIRLLAAGGSAAAAQRQYAEFARLLARELSAEPSAATRALLAQVRQVDSVPLPSSQPPSSQPPALQTVPLPLPLTTFHGREALLSEVGTMLENPAVRLITLLGTGGIGKTRLALELARRRATCGLEASPEAAQCAFVSLADVAEAHLIADTVAGALTPLRETPPLQRIIAALTAPPGAPPFLLVLDNAEHLAEAIGVVAAELLAAIPRLQILATSQRPLQINGEHEVLLTPLALPEITSTSDQAPSVRLFLDRARSVRPGFSSDPATLADVARICTRLEGLPLAIELCAGWAQTLGTRQMLELLVRRFELLVSRRTDIPARHRTLRAAIEYSFMQLSEPMQEFFVQLSIFRSGWTLEAAAAVCTGGSVPAALDLLAQMGERSLLAADEARAGEGMRYKMLESLRDFAAEQRTLVQARVHGQAHAAYFARFVSETTARMQGAEDALWAVRLDDEMDNIRAALDFLLSAGDTHTAWTMIAEAGRAWISHGHAREAEQWTARALVDEAAKYPSLRARLLTVRAEALRVLSNFSEALANAEDALALWQSLGDTRGAIECTDILGVVALLNNDFDRAHMLLANALPLARTLGDDSITAKVLNNLGRIAMGLRDWATAQERMAEGLALRRQAGDVRSTAGILGNLGLVHRYQGDYDAARVLFQEAILLQEQHHVVWYSSMDLNLATVERLSGCYSASLHRLEVAHQNALADGERRVIAWCVKEMGHLAIAINDFSLGLRLLSCAEAMRLSLGITFKPLGPEDIARDRTAAEAALGPAEAAAHWTLGASADPELLLTQAEAELAAHLPVK